MNRARKPLAVSADVDAAPPRTAMVMVAGLGKRMRPLTATRPKPLVEVGDKTLLDHCLDRLAEGGVEKAVVNVHYLADALEAHVRRRTQGPDIVISDERAQLLETGGGLMHARPLIDADPFLCVNSDNLWVDGPVNTLRLLASRWDDGAMDALLLLVPQARAHNHNGAGDFHMDGLGRLSRRQPGKVAPFVYTGIQMLSKRVLKDAPEGPFSTNLFWDRAIAEGRCFGLVHQGLWFDVGTPAAIPATEAVIAHG